jgi:hypothetical protein
MRSLTEIHGGAQILLGLAYDIRDSFEEYLPSVREPAFFQDHDGRSAPAQTPDRPEPQTDLWHFRGSKLGHLHLPVRRVQGQARRLIISLNYFVPASNHWPEWIETAPAESPSQSRLRGEAPARGWGGIAEGAPGGASRRCCAAREPGSRRPAPGWSAALEEARPRGRLPPPNKFATVAAYGLFT